MQYSDSFIGKYPPAIAVLLVWMLTGCASRNDTHPHLTFWSSTNPEEMQFVTSYLDRWNADHPGTKVIFQPVPEGQSSEEVILAAVVGGTTPDIYANMWQGDVEDFAQSGVLIPLDTLDGFLDFIYTRCDSQVIREITSADGHIYQIPWKVNPVMMMYNPDLYTHHQDTTTYSDFLQTGAAITMPGRWLGISEVNAIWWQRFFNFLPLYYAASGGAPLVENGKAIFNSTHGVEVFAFLQEIYQKKYFPREQMKGQRDPFLAGVVATTFTGPWTIEYNEKFKAENFKYHFADVPVPDHHQGPVYTYGDPKNIVLFSTCQQPEQAWKVLQTMLTDQADLDFLQLSRQFPRRKDINENPLFTDYLDKHPELIPFARQTRHLRGMDSARYMKEVLDLISQEYEACVVYGQKSPETAIADAARAVELLYIK